MGAYEKRFLRPPRGLDRPGSDRRGCRGGLRHIKACKQMADVGFDGLADETDGDLRLAWRTQLAREGKLNPTPAACGTWFSEWKTRGPSAS